MAPYVVGAVLFIALGVAGLVTWSGAPETWVGGTGGRRCIELS